jgi:sulfopropanediol 3-dehydrogenase
MVHYLKRGKDAATLAEADAKVRQTVERIMADIENRGDAAVRALSLEFDGWTRDDFRLTAAEIDAAVAKVPKEDLEDIRFAQEQVRNFAMKQRDSIHDTAATCPAANTPWSPRPTCQW